MSAESATISGRRSSEAIMKDTCRITRSGGRPVYDPETEQTTVPTPSTVYEGKCKVQQTSMTSQTTEAGSQVVELYATRVDVPMSVVDVKVDDDIEIVTSLLDARLVGAHSRVDTVLSKSYATARRLGCVGTVST
jgi:hypothetical protein